MPRAGPNVALLVTMTGMALVLCGGLMVTMEYAKTELKLKGAGEKGKAPAAPQGKFAARIKELDRDEFAVTQQGQNDSASFGRYVRTAEPGLYLDVVSGEALFSSLDKLESVFGYAEFSKPFNPAELLEQEGTVTGVSRLLVRSKTANSYLGWIEKDESSGARRYVINSSALRFVPVAELEKYGLGQHRALFPDNPPAP